MALKVIIGAFVVVLVIFSALFIIGRSNLVPTYERTNSILTVDESQNQQQIIPSSPFKKIILPEGVIPLKCEPTAALGEQNCPLNHICGYLTNPDGSRMTDEAGAFITGCQSQLVASGKSNSGSATFIYYVDSFGKNKGVVKYISNPPEGGEYEGTLSVEQAREYIRYLSEDMGWNVKTQTQVSEIDPTTHAIREVPTSNLGFLFGLFILSVLSLGIYFVYKKVGKEED